MTCTDNQHRHSPPRVRPPNFGTVVKPARVRLVDTILDLAHREVIGRCDGLTWLSQVQLTADEQAFDDALEALRNRDGLLDGVVDPYVLLEVLPSVGVERARTFAVEEQERTLAAAVEVLAAPAVQVAAPSGGVL